MASPDTAIVTHLAAAGLGLVAAPASTANLFAGQVLPPTTGAPDEPQSIPHEAVFCLATGGPRVENYNANNAGPSTKWLTVQVRIRSAAGDQAGGITLARAVWTALHRAALSGYISCECRDAQPVSMGRDDTEHFHYAINVVAVVSE